MGNIILDKIENLKKLQELFNENSKVIFGNQGDIDSLKKDFEKTIELTIKEVLKLIKAWDGYGDDRFPEGELKELVREIKKLKKISDNYASNK